MAFETILFDVFDGIGQLTLNRPQTMNALTAQVVDEIHQALDQVESGTTNIRCLLVTGAGRGFSSGFDLASAAADLANENRNQRTIDAGHVLETHLNPLMERLMALPVPLVTAVNGAAAGGGCSFALAGDIVVAAKSAYFLQAFVNIGLVPDVGSTWLLPRLIGKQRAQAMMMLGEKITAPTALEWGMVYQVVEDAALMDTAHAIATRLANGPTVALSLIRRGIRQALDSTLTEALQAERVAQLQAGQSADFLEGVTAFLEKRPARFTGK